MQGAMYNVALKLALIKKDMNQRDLARKAKIPEAYISLAMWNKYNLTPQKQTRIAEILDMRVDELFPE